MLDIGFSELLLFGIVALVILGPDKLPPAIRTAGRWYARIRFMVGNLQQDIEKELQLTELREHMQQELNRIKGIEAHMQQQMNQMSGELAELHNTAPTALTKAASRAATVYLPFKLPDFLTAHLPVNLTKTSTNTATGAPYTYAHLLILNLAGQHSSLQVAELNHQPQQQSDQHLSQPLTHQTEFDKRSDLHQQIDFHEQQMMPAKSGTLK